MRRGIALCRCCVSLAGVAFLLGCTEGTKPNPQPRAGFAATATDAAKKPEAKPARTLYERLGREEGLQAIAEHMMQDLRSADRSKEWANKLSVRRLANLLVELSSNAMPGLAEDLRLSDAEWEILVAVLRDALTYRLVADRDRDEILTHFAKAR